MSKKFNIDGSLQVTEKIVVQGDLEVRGSTTTVDQETLTIKDNFIAVNGTGTSLDTVQKVGLIAITGKEQYTLNDGFYDINSEALMNLLGAETYVDETAPWASMLGPYRVRFSNTENINRLAKLKPMYIMAKANGNMFYCTSGLQISTQTQYQPNGAISIDTNDFPDSWICSCGFDTEGNITNISESSYLLNFYNQIVTPEDVEFIKQFLVKDDGSGPVTDANFSSSQQAYAAPIYDKTDDTLKIGSGSFTRDANGNVDSFTFGAGQAQAIATRADDISDKALVAWDAVNNRLIENPYPYIGLTQYSTDIGDIWNALDNKISKSPNVFNMAYGKGQDGNDKEWHIVPFPTGTPKMDAALTGSQILCTVPLGVGESAPDLNGTLVVPEPTAAYEVANKKYVDENAFLPTKLKELNDCLICTFYPNSINETIDLTKLTTETVEVNWGDGIVDNLLTHTYANYGPYVITINGLTTIGDNAFSTMFLGDVVIGKKITSIGEGAFEGCPLANIEISEGVTSIGVAAFGGPNEELKSIAIPASVTSIGDFAFYSCYSLTNMTIRAITPPTLGQDIFDDSPMISRIEVPIESLETYKTAAGWSDYADLIVGVDLDSNSLKAVLEKNFATTEEIYDIFNEEA